MTRKELKEEYKNKKFRMGVFQIRNLVNGKIFLEGSSNLEAIWNRHRAQLDFGSHPVEDLQKDWKSYGASNFVYEVLAELEQNENPNLDVRKEIKALEQLYLEELQPFDAKGYNRRPKV